MTRALEEYARGYTKVGSPLNNKLQFDSQDGSAKHHYLMWGKWENPDYREYFEERETSELGAIAADDRLVRRTNFKSEK